MLTFAEDQNNDTYLDASGNIAMLTKADTVGQLCKSRIESQRGEMVYAMDQGMPTRATAWDRYNPGAFEAAARAIILATSSEVVSITAFSISQNGNELDYSATIKTIYGITTI